MKRDQLAVYRKQLLELDNRLDAEIDEIAAFVKKNPRARIHITRDAMESTRAKR